MVFECKICGGKLHMLENGNLAECENCDSIQTVPTVDDEKKSVEFNLANKLRMQMLFDRAASAYERLIIDFPREAEAYWGLCLCEFGIEYVDDPYSDDMKPTCHRTMVTSMTEDENFKKAVLYADETSKKYYLNQAQEIDRINHDIIEIVKTQKPYDCFICYKEKDNDDQRTQDSLLAERLYDKLTEKGYRVFFSHVTMDAAYVKDYEAIIFSALTTARVMITVCTRPEYMQAPWVRNEWGRFLRLMAKDSKKVIIPCYKDMSPYDLPPEIKSNQAHDLGRVGKIEEISRYMQEFFPEKKFSSAAVISSVDNTGANLLKRGNFALTDGDRWDEANGFFDEVLNLEAENGEAYLGKFLARKRARSLSEYFDRNVKESAEVQSETVIILDQGIKEQHQRILRENEVPDFFDKATIEGYLDKIPATYTSTLRPQQNDLQKRVEDLHNNGDYMRSIQFSSAQFSARITQQEKEYVARLQELVDRAAEKDQKDRAAAVAAYQADLAKVEKVIREGRDKFLGILNEKYNAAGMKQANAHSHSELVQAQKEFEALKSFKDSKQRAQQVKAQADAAYNNANMRYTQAYPLLQQREQVTTRLEATRRSLGGLNSDETKRKMWLILAGGFFIFDLLVFVISGGFSDIDGIGDFLVLLIGFVIGSAIGGLVFRPVLRTIRRAQLMVKERKDAKLMAQIESIPPFRADDFRF
ncbi:MAG: toll/interleukin-1 receptor domain-containing protein [Clostridia bacterium]|nr:toll/interleukin-1 receptor domain-containing protein [Clostridia bacterium]